MRARGFVTIAVSLSMVAAGLGLGACGDEEPAETIESEPESTDTTETEPEEPSEPTEQQAAAAPGEAAAEVDDPTFLLRATTSGTYAAGELGQFAISLTPKGEYHVNEEYPISVELTAPDGVSLAKSTLERDDCAEFGEDAARFDVPFTPGSAGEHTVQAKISFAVCTPENCVPDERTLAVLLPVE